MAVDRRPKEILALLGQTLDKYPDFRVGQLIATATPDQRASGMFYMSDSEFLDNLLNYAGKKYELYGR